MEKGLNTLLKSSYMLVHLCLIGQGYSRRRGKLKWLRGGDDAQDCLQVVLVPVQIFGGLETVGAARRPS
jgi:hypothetical protein